MSDTIECRLTHGGKTQRFVVHPEETADTVLRLLPHAVWIKVMIAQHARESAGTLERA